MPFEGLFSSHLESNGSISNFKWVLRSSITPSPDQARTYRSWPLSEDTDARTRGGVVDTLPFLASLKAPDLPLCTYTYPLSLGFGQKRRQ